MFNPVQSYKRKRTIRHAEQWLQENQSVILSHARPAWQKASQGGVIRNPRGEFIEKVIIDKSWGQANTVAKTTPVSAVTVIETKGNATQRPVAKELNRVDKVTARAYEFEPSHGWVQRHWTAPWQRKRTVQFYKDNPRYLYKHARLLLQYIEREEQMKQDAALFM